MSGTEAGFQEPSSGFGVLCLPRHFAAPRKQLFVITITPSLGNRDWVDVLLGICFISRYRED